jgi:outer membrane protein assembly factor BamD
MRRVWIAALFLVAMGCGGKNAEVSVPSGISEPDKVLYNTAIKDLGRSRYNVARLTLQTLIQTYPDSEFLAQAKYALAESFYREGTSSNLNQAEAEYKDFITFFPTDDRADDAQLMVALTHVRQMGKADRDSSQAMLAESELTRMIESYPDSDLLDEAKEKLRAVQEVLAEGEFRVGNTYFIRRAYRAAMGRYTTVLTKYPDYTRMPEVLYNMGEALRNSDNPEAAIYYARIVKEYPFAEQTRDAKDHLTAMKYPIPEASPAALARGEPPKVKKGVFGSLFSPLGKGPGVSIETKATTMVEPEPKENKDNKKDNKPKQ